MKVVHYSNLLILFIESITNSSLNKKKFLRFVFRRNSDLNCLFRNILLFILILLTMVSEIQISKKITKTNELISLVIERGYKRGLIKFNKDYRKRSRLFNPKVFNSFLLLLMVRDVSCLFVKDKQLSIVLGDFSHDWELGFQWKLVCICWEILVFIIQIVNHFLYKNKNNFKIMENESKRVVIDKNRVNFVRKFDLNLTFFSFIVPIILSFGSMALKFTIKETITFGIFWNLVFSFSITYASNLYIWSLFQFFLFCYRSKLLIRRENCKISQIVSNKTPLSDFRVKGILKNLNIIYLQIEKLNEIWCKFIFISWVVFSLVIGNVVIQIFSGDLGLLMTFMLIAFSLYDLECITFVMLSASSLNSASKRTYKLLSDLFVKQNFKKGHFLFNSSGAKINKNLRVCLNTIV